MKSLFTGLGKVGFGVVLASMTLAACGIGTAVIASATPEQQAQQIEAQAQGKADLHFDQTQPVPYYPYSQLRQELKDIESWQATGATGTAFFMSNNDVAMYSCSTTGAPLPADSELTNPYHAVWNSGSNGADNGGAGVATGNEDPVGVYSGNTSGTYVPCVANNGQVYPVYWEGNVLLFGADASWSVPLGQTGGHANLVGSISKVFDGIGGSGN